MTTAQAMYRAFGFVEVPRFDGSEAATAALDPFTIFMELDLDVEPLVAQRCAGVSVAGNVARW